MAGTYDLASALAKGIELRKQRLAQQQQAQQQQPLGGGLLAAREVAQNIFGNGVSMPPLHTPRPTGILSALQGNGLNIYNNPGNVERTQNWAGSIAGKGYGEDDRPNRFAIFNSPVMGVRALARDIRKKINDMDGDLLKIISKYAPSIENDTKGYKEFVSKEIDKEDKVTLKDLPKIVKAIIKFENVQEVEDYYLDDPSILNEGILLSLYDLPQNYNLAMSREYHKHILANPPSKPKFKPRKKK